MMTIPTSVNKLQGNNATPLTQQTNANNQSAEAAAGFAQQLAKASSTLNSTGALNSPLTDAQNIASAMDINFDFNNSAISSSGLSSNDFLSQSLKSGMQAQFNTLGKDIATTFIAGLAGQDSATAVASEPAEATTKTAGTDPSSEVTSDTVPSTNKALNETQSTEGIQAVNEENGKVAEQQNVQPEAQESLTSSLIPESLRGLLDAIQNFSFSNDNDTDANDENTDQANSSDVEDVEDVTNADVTNIAEEKAVS